MAIVVVAAAEAAVAAVASAEAVASVDYPSTSNAKSISTKT